jgi:predicted ATP-dependent endonuclease of OLD family
MSSWVLKIRNFGGFKDLHEFELKKGLNWIIGENATGKTSIINSIKLLNKFVQNSDEVKEKINGQDHIDYLHDKTKIGKIELINESLNYFRMIKSPASKITSYLNEKSQIDESKEENLIAKDPNLIKFSFIDKDNRLMEAIEYSGSISQIKEEIVRISKIQYFELILRKSKDLNLEYTERKEKELKNYNDKRKELELKIRNNSDQLQKYEKIIENINVDENLSKEAEELKEKRRKKEDLYNSINYGELEPLNEEYNKLLVNIEKNNNKLDLLEHNQSELKRFIENENNIIKNEQQIQNFDEKINNLNNNKKNIFIRLRTLDFLMKIFFLLLLRLLIFSSKF